MRSIRSRVSCLLCVNRTMKIKIQPPLAQKLNFRMYKIYIIHYVLLHGIYPLVGLHQKSYSFVAITRLISDTTNSWVNTMRKDFHVVFYKIMHLMNL